MFLIALTTLSSHREVATVLDSADQDYFRQRRKFHPTPIFMWKCSFRGLLSSLGLVGGVHVGRKFTAALKGPGDLGLKNMSQLPNRVLRYAGSEQRRHPWGRGSACGLRGTISPGTNLLAAWEGKAGRGGPGQILRDQNQGQSGSHEW